MNKENIFSKLGSKDYNNQLEKILENKDFSENVKNLLLSMLYRIQVGYDDYTTVKRIVENKKDYIEEILQIIKEKCKKIIIVEKDSKESEEMEKRGTNFIVDKLEQTIFLRYPNESLLLYTIYKIDDRQIYLDEKYNLIRNSLSELLNAGENINNIEVIRDFNGWSWNTQIKEIPEITTNTIYQNLIYLLGINFIKEWVHKEEIIDYINLVEKKLENDYGKEKEQEILKLVYKISIIICTNKNEIEKKRLLEEQEILQNELNKLKDKKTLLNEISNSKKELLQKIKEIDTIINDKKLLEEEYIKRNEKRAEYNKIFSISHLTEILNKERKKYLSKIEENNQLLEPKYYVGKKQNLEEQLELLEDINLGKDEKEKRKYKYLIQLQKVFIKCFNIKINNAQEREDVINLIFMLRYYNYLYIAKEKQIKDVKELQKEIKDIEDNLIKKAYELKIINNISNEQIVNNEIIRNILLTKIIKIENVHMELNQNDSSLEIKLYDTDVYEKAVTIPVYDKKEIIVKFNKIIKIFNY